MYQCLPFNTELNTSTDVRSPNNIIGYFIFKLIFLYAVTFDYNKYHTFRCIK